MTRGKDGGPPSGPLPPAAGDGAKTREMGEGGKAEADSSAENLEVADKAALDLDEPGRFTSAKAAAVITPVVDAAWKPKVTSASQIGALVVNGLCPASEKSHPPSLRLGQTPCAARIGGTSLHAAQRSAWGPTAWVGLRAEPAS